MVRAGEWRVWIPGDPEPWAAPWTPTEKNPNRHPSEEKALRDAKRLSQGFGAVAIGYPDGEEIWI